MNTPSINWVDLVLFLFLVGGLIVGFTRGLLWEFIGLASLYVGTVIATQYYAYLTDFLRRLAGQTASTKLLTVMAFLFLLFFIALLMSWLVSDVFRSTKLKIPASIDYLGGTVIGLTSVVALIILLAPIVVFATSETWPAGWPEAMRGFFSVELEHSFLMPIFNELKPLMLESLKPWLPTGYLPSIFSF